MWNGPSHSCLILDSGHWWMVYAQSLGAFLFSLSSPEISCFHNIGYRTMTVSSWNHDWSHMPYAPMHVCIITRTWMSAYLCMSAWVYTYLFSPHCHVVGVCSHHKHGISEHWTTGPMGNSRVRFLPASGHTFLSLDKYKSLFYVCFCLKTPCLIYTVVSLALNSQPIAL